MKCSKVAWMPKGSLRSIQKSKQTLVLLLTRHWKVCFSKKKEHETPPIWGHLGPIQASSRTYCKIKKTAFFEGRWYTGRKIRQIWAEWAVYVGCQLQKGWFFDLAICTSWSLNGSRMTPGRWRFMFFFFAESYFQMKCDTAVATATSSKKFQQMSQ